MKKSSSRGSEVSAMTAILQLQYVACTFNETFRHRKILYAWIPDGFASLLRNCIQVEIPLVYKLRDWNYIFGNRRQISIIKLLAFCLV